MKMVNVAICDDEVIIAEELKNLICKYENAEMFNFFIFNNGKELLLSDLKSYDMVFLDIELGDMCGIDIGIELKKINKNAILFYVTNHTNYISEALKQTPFQFIIKPLKEKENLFIEEFSRGLDKLRQLRNVMSIKTNNGNEVIKIHTIQYIECLNRKIEIHLKDRVVQTSGKIKDFRTLLLPYEFEQCHMSFIVNLRSIVKIKGYDVFLSNNEILPISKRYLSNFKEKFNKYIAGMSIL